MSEATQPETSPSEETTSQPSGGVVKHSDDIARQIVRAGKGTQSQVLLGPQDGTPNFALRRFTMETGGGIPLHTNQVEHEQYVLSGRARIEIAGEVHEVSPGDVLYIPAGVPHSYETLEGPFEFLCIVPNGPDRIDILKPKD